ncbi:MAG: hypothetical protein A3B70_07910 [Deltaproteobacteria bacterium RIFCSPHIGHO2_02_FULL_40_11]|nr:MAG: hypothetical protein A3B70_07910 [Deltaproteobacteria bacterium RIFCSPHIGHO2_02_FULL_40_11]
MRVLSQVDLTEIDFEDKTFEVCFLPQLEHLKKSIERVGIVTPLTLRKSDSGKYQIISGFRRFYVAQALNLSPLPAVLIEDSILSIDLFNTSVEESLFNRKLNLVEVAIVIQKLKSTFDVSKEDIFQKYFPRLGIQRSERLFQFYCELTLLDLGVQALMVQMDLPIHLVEEFMRYTLPEQKLLIPFLEKVHFSVSTLQDFLIWIDEISVRDDLEIEKILGDIEFQKILEDTHLTGKQKYYNLREVLKAKRYPQLTALQDRFTSLKKKLDLPLEQPDFFENNKVQLKFSFRDKKEFESLVQKMNTALLQPELEDILKDL